MQRSRGWCLTINNHTEDDELLCFDVAHSCRYCVFGREIGESGTSHLQGYIYFDTLKSFDQVKLLFPTAHIEKQRGTCKQASDYCKKDGDFFEHGELPLSDQDKGERGKQAIAERWELAKAGRFDELPPECIKTYEYIHAKYAEVNDLDGDLDNWWIWGESGCGKNSFVHGNPKYHVAPRWPKEEIYIKDINKWWDAYMHQPIVVIHDIDPRHPTTSNIAYNLKIWAQHQAFRAECKGGSMMARPKSIVITSQYPIEAVFPNPEDQAAIKRRFKVYRPVPGQFAAFYRES